MRNLIPILVVSFSQVATALAQNDTATQSTANAAILYAKAAAALKVDSPGNSSTIFNDVFKASNPQWRHMEAVAWNANRRARQLVHDARRLNFAAWSVNDAVTLDKELSDCWQLMGDLKDAAYYADYMANDALAIEIIRDIHHMGALLRRYTPNTRGEIQGAAIEAHAADALMAISASVALTNNPQNTSNLNITVARDLIAELLGEPEIKESDLRGIEYGRHSPVEIVRRCEAEQKCAAISLACHLYRFDKGDWTPSLDQLIPAYLPSIPLDPCGDGGQTIGYALIPGGLPDGTDRPLLYFRADAGDGLFYRLDEPEYWFYDNDGSKRPSNLQKHGGQFRDVARWQPQEIPFGPTTRALP